MQKQDEKGILKCTFRKCKEAQCEENEFCTNHQAKKGRDDLINALNQLDEWAEGYTSEEYKERTEQEKLYNLLMDFIIYS